MSVTTLANPVTTTLSRTLADYEIHLTGDDVHGHIAAQNARDDTVDTNPAHWLQNRRRIPPRRPINRDLDPDERPNGMNAFETTFLRIMFTGVATVAVGLLHNPSDGT